MRMGAIRSSGSFVGFSMFPNGTLSSLGLDLDSACESALYQTVDCDDATSTLMTDGYIGSFDNATLTASVCAAGCGSSLAQLHADVATSCGEAAKLIDGLPFLSLVDMLWSNWNQSCFYDPATGENCNDVIAAFSNVTDVTLLPTEDLCSSCYLQKFALLQADAFSGVYEENWQSTYETVAAACNVTVADFNITDSAFNVTVPTTETNCVSGNTYTAQAGDTCDAIALAHSVSAASLYHINSNIHNCSAVAAGTTLCLPLACATTYTVQADDTCTGIAVDAGLYTSDVRAFNTLLDWNCTNLHATNPYWGATLCVSTPGGTYNSSGATAATGAGDDSAAAAVVDPPAGATICLNYGVAINLFTAANPALNKTTCDDDLVLGDAYCLDPITGWDWTGTASASANATATVSGAVPTPTEPGAIDSCTVWHCTVSGDTCYDIAQTAGIALDDFYAWNTEVGDDCSDLWLNYYVCVGV
ncbi:hypothetical protein INS49_007242 [Diaporthe citri]|uniref:uncharacterized protein n=1 Tax=Diaporthe citri TaxID=83186 RepID=UPI001C7EAA85|nr:uncharacterized protein INS49_007242 [Diaporthe citri]KAG6365631.1 hypothetical protein INS49_007242 [Diaporthe citri]